MLGKRRLHWTLWLLGGDTVVLLAAFFVAYGLRVALNAPLDRAAGPLAYYLWLLTLIVPVWLGGSLSSAATGSRGRPARGLGWRSA